VGFSGPQIFVNTLTNTVTRHKQVQRHLIEAASSMQGKLKGWR
jgi:hypothetical protein